MEKKEVKKKVKQFSTEILKTNKTEAELDYPRSLWYHKIYFYVESVYFLFTLYCASIYIVIESFPFHIWQT